VATKMALKVKLRAAVLLFSLTGFSRADEGMWLFDHSLEIPSNRSTVWTYPLAFWIACGLPRCELAGPQGHSSHPPASC
jgi:hypothetical protein